MPDITQEQQNKYNTRISAIVIDDNKELRDLFVEILEIRGIRVAGTGADGEEAVWLYQIHRPDIVFLDAKMPGHDGFYALSKIREFDPYGKIVLVTGSNQEKALLDNCKANIIVEKPIDVEEIMDITCKLTGKYLENIQ
ncbi:MAG TPA: response regulator [Candidatus Nitrosotalea sp.]|nr:response regulator [Candidatus Nitrosotalea sp.]